MLAYSVFGPEFLVPIPHSQCQFQVSNPPGPNQSPQFKPPIPQLSALSADTCTARKVINAQKKQHKWRSERRQKNACAQGSGQDALVLVRQEGPPGCAPGPSSTTAHHFPANHWPLAILANRQRKQQWAPGGRPLLRETNNFHGSRAQTDEVPHPRGHGPGPWPALFGHQCSCHGKRWPLPS